VDQNEPVDQYKRHRNKTNKTRWNCNSQFSSSGHQWWWVILLSLKNCSPSQISLDI
jgi:hypothetical protein